MRLTKLGLLTTFCCVLSLGGCSGRVAPTDQPSVSQDSSSETPAPPAPPVLNSSPDAKKATSKVQTQAKAAPDAKKPPRVKAQTGVGQKGRRLENEKLVQTIVTPAVSLFRTRERMVFEVQIPQAMKLYKGLHGEPPQTEKEFFEQIIKANRISLPELPAGQRYVYDPRKAQLMVERPAQ